MIRITRIRVYQTARVVGIIAFLVCVIGITTVALLTSFAGGEISVSGFTYAKGFLVIIIPFMYALIGFLSTAVVCLIFNFVSSWIGGIELELEKIDSNRVKGEFAE